MRMATFLTYMFKRKKHKKLRLKDQKQFLKRLIRLMDTGYSLLDSLEMIAWDKRFSSICHQLSLSLKEGNHIDEAFNNIGFASFIIEQLYFIRFNGDLITTLQKCYRAFVKRLEYQERFIKVIRYPAILLLIFTVLMYFMKNSVLPAFLKMFQHHAESKKTVSISLFLMNSLMTLIFILIILFTVSIVLWSFIKKNLPIQKQLKLFEYIPILRKFIEWRTSFQFATHIATLLNAGLSFNQVLHHLLTQEKLPILSYYANILTRELNEGQHISHILDTFKFIEKQIVYIFENQTEMTSLTKDLESYSDLLTDRIEHLVTKIITYIQPIFFGLIAIFIVLIYISLLFPMFQLLQTM